MPESDATKKETDRPEEELEDLSPEKDAMGGGMRRNVDAGSAPDAQKKEEL